MKEILEAAQNFAPLVAGLLVPLVTGVFIPLLTLKREPRDPAAVRSMARHVQLHDALPKESRAAIRKLLHFEAEKYARTLMRKGTRKLDSSTLAALIFVAVTTGVVEYFLIFIAFYWWPAALIAGGVAGFSGALLSVGARNLYVYEEIDPLARELKVSEAESRVAA